MGKIMKEGKQYGVGGVVNAESISYSNTVSGLSALDVQNAIDEVENVVEKEYGRCKEIRINHQSSRTINFSSYNTTALIFMNCGSGDYGVWVYNYGYLCPITGNSSLFEATLSQDYLTITVTNNHTGRNSILCVISPNETPFTVS